MENIQYIHFKPIGFVCFEIGGELSTLAKKSRNVYLGMCWLYIISPSKSERYLHEWLETVPANKIRAFKVPVKRGDQFKCLCIRLNEENIVFESTSDLFHEK